MPDIFDQISPPKGDVFDQVAASGAVQNLNATATISPMPLSQRLMAYAPIRAIHDAIVGPAVQPAVGQMQGLLPIAARIAYGNQQKPGVLNISPGAFVRPPQNEAEGAAKAVLDQMNLQNATITKLIEPLIGATGTGANLLKAGTAAYLTAQGAKGAAQQAGERVSGTQTPAQAGESDVNMVLNALQAAGSPFLASGPKTPPSVIDKVFSPNNRYVSGEMTQGTPEFPFAMPAPKPRFQVGTQGDIFDVLQPTERRSDLIRPAQASPVVIGGQLPLGRQVITPEMLTQSPTTITTPYGTFKQPIEPSGGEVSFRGQAGEIPHARQQAQESTIKYAPTVRELRPDRVSETQPPGNIQKMGEEVRQGANAQGDAREGQGQTQGQEQTQLIRKVNPTPPPGQPGYGIPGNVSFTDPKTGFTVENLPPNTTPEQAIPMLQKKMQRDLVPAIATDNGIIKAKSEQELSHDDVLKANGIEPASIPHEDPRRGFVDSMGNWYTRKQAEEVTGIKGTAKAGGLDSMDLPRASYEKGKYAEDWKNAQAAAEKRGVKLYGGLFFLDPDFWKDQIRIAGNVKTDGQMLYNRMRNALGKDSAAWKAVDTEAFRKFVVGAGRVSPDEVREYLEKTGLKVEVRKFGEGGKTPLQQEHAKLAHEFFDTLSPSEKQTIQNFYVNKQVVDRYAAPLFNRGKLSPKFISDANRWLELQRTPEAYDSGNNAHWSSVAPKPESSMPGYIEIAVVKPLKYKENTSRVKLEQGESIGGAPGSNRVLDQRNELPDPQFPSSHSFPPNTLGFVRGYMETTPDGKKVFHVIEAQSDIAEKIRDGVFGVSGHPELGEFKSKREVLQAASKIEPLATHYERLALKAAIDHARSQGADAIAISDAETAMMTEGHDRQVYTRGRNNDLLQEALRSGTQVFEFAPKEQRFEEAWQELPDKWKKIIDSKTGEGIEGGKAYVMYNLDGVHYVIKEIEGIPQYEGMRLHYDRTLPKIAEELTGEKGKRVEFGEHKMARAEIVQHGELSRAGEYRKDLIFKNERGEPKTTVTARQYPLTKARKNFSLFGSDKPKPQNVVDVIPEVKPGGLFSGVPIFDPELLGITPERAAALKDKYLKMLAAKGQSVASDLASAPKQFAPKSARAAAILGSTTARPMERTQELIAQPGEKLGIGERAGNLARRLAQVAGEADKVVNPWDVLYDWMDGGKAKYNGPLMENIRKPLDADFNDELNLRSQLLEPIRDLIKKNKMGKEQSQRIGVYLNTLQEGGRDRMIASGIKPEIIAKIEKSITPAEKAVAQSIRQMYDDTFPLIQKVAKDVDGINLNPIDNYFSWEREWRKYKPDADELASPKVPAKGATVDDVLWPGLESVRVRTKPGSIEKRIPGAATPIKIDAFEIVDRYVRDASHYIAMRKHLKEISEIVRTDEFAEKYGQMGQDLIMEHLNTIARQGRYKRNGFLDGLRKLTSRGVIAYRLPSQFVHLANIPLGMQRAGVARWYKGLDEALSNEGQAFLKKNFAETFERGGGEPALREVAEGNLGKRSVYDKVSQGGFWLQRKIDQLNAQATVLGVYMRELEKKGKNAEDYAELPVDKAALDQARVEARRAVASPLYKDVPPLLNRGGSMMKSLMQFQNTFLDQWSNIRYDLAQVGVPEAFKLNPKLAFQMTAALAAMLLVETGVKYGYKQALNKATGAKPREDESFAKTLEHEATRRIPGMGQVQSQILYGETGVPSIDALEEPIKQGYKYAKATDKSTKTLSATRGIGAAAEVAGIPAASQLTDIASAVERKQLFKSHTQRLKEQEGKDVEQMTLKQRYAAEAKYKKTEPPMSKMEQASAAERSIANIAKRGEEVTKELDKATQNWIASRGLTVPGYDNKLKIGKEDIYLDEKEVDRLHSYIKDEYVSALAQLKTRESKFDKLPADEQKVYFNETLLAARSRARFKLMQELSRSQNEHDKKETSKKKFSIFNND